MLGYRARIGYTAPISIVEVFPYEFYRMVPEGVTLLIATNPAGERGQVADGPISREQANAVIEAAAREMASVGANIIVVGGSSPAFGLDRLARQARELEAEFGIQVTNTREAQVHALKVLGTKRSASSCSGPRPARKWIGSRTMASRSLASWGRATPRPILGDVRPMPPPGLPASSPPSTRRRTRSLFLPRNGPRRTLRLWSRSSEGT
jgi:hypothetical protein